MDWPIAGAFAVTVVTTLVMSGLVGSKSAHEVPHLVVLSSASAPPLAQPPAASAPVKTAVSTSPQPAAAIAPASTPAAVAPKPSEWVVPDVDKLPNDAWGKMVRLGRDLTVNTSALIGPEAIDPAKHFTGSNISCQSCHLEAGTKKFGLPFIGVFADFPQYRAREGEVGSLEDRVNGCMTRSENGRLLPLDSAEMKAFVAYIKFLSTGRPIGNSTSGRGSGEMPELTRPADPLAGAKVFAENCVACHGANGLGKRVGVVGDGKGYEFPPLWGPDSFNNGAGMGRLISAANFIHSNMPNGTTADHPVLTVEQSWDVAAYVESMQRPEKDHVDKDFPVRLEKPVDAGYTPYVDGFSQDQHRVGPFQPIRDKLKELKKAAAAKPAAQ